MGPIGRVFRDEGQDYGAIVIGPLGREAGSYQRNGTPAVSGLFTYSISLMERRIAPVDVRPLFVAIAAGKGRLYPNARLRRD